MSRVFFHIGAHKTATSSLQRYFRENSTIFGPAGCRFSHLLRDEPRIASLFRVMATEGRPIPENIERLKAWSRSLADSSSHHFVSFESVLGRGTLANGGIYPAYRELLPAFSDVFSGHDLHVGFCLRDYAAFVESTYVWSVQRGSTQSFAEYLACFDLDALDWRPLVHDLSQSLGAGHLHLWTFEDFVRDPFGCFSWVAGRATDGALTRLIDQNIPKSNPSYSAQALALALSFNADITRVAADRGLQASPLVVPLRKVLAGMYPTGRFAKPVLLTEEQRHSLTERYRNHMVELRNALPSATFFRPGVAQGA